MKLRGIIIFLIASVLICGCFNVKQSPQKIDYYTLEYTPPLVHYDAPLPHVLKMVSFQVSPVYDADKFLFRDNAFKRNEYFHHRWRTNPGDLITTYLVRDFSQAALFKAVISSEALPTYSHVITGTVEEFFQQKAQQESMAVLSVNITLTDYQVLDISESFLFQKRYKIHVRLRDDTPAGFVDAMSQAVRQLSEEMIMDVYTILLKQIPESKELGIIPQPG
jgi:ABC-type uncharacterized transport system auxiliary subunit